MKKEKCQAQKYKCAPQKYVPIIAQKYIRKAIEIDFYFCTEYNEIVLEIGWGAEQ